MIVWRSWKAWKDRAIVRWLFLCRIKILERAWVRSLLHRAYNYVKNTISRTNKWSWKAYTKMAPGILTVFRANSKFNQISQCSGLRYAWSITTTFCTRHDNGKCFHLMTSSCVIVTNLIIKLLMSPVHRQPGYWQYDIGVRQGPHLLT